MELTEQRKIRLSLFIPTLLTFVMWAVKAGEWLFDTSFSFLGILPRSPLHLHGVLFSPFLHSNWEHLWANTISFFVLSWALFFFYREIASKIFLLLYFFSGLLLWSLGRPSFHIGMSGMIYAIAFFLITSGFIRKNYRLMALTLIVVFLYGSLFWGLFPIERHVSWEGHLSGAFVGLVLAMLFRKQGPQPPTILSEDDDSIPEEIWNAEQFISEDDLANTDSF